MSRLCLAILAHNNRPCLDDFLLNIRAFVPSAEVVLFNGGRDQSLFDGLDLEICPYSHPLEYGRGGGTAPFHFQIMRWLHEERRDYEFLITLDSDMLFIKPGIETYLEDRMRNAGYMAVLFQEVTPKTRWLTGRRFHIKWRQVWQPIFGTRNPYGCFNPGQVFRKEFAERLMNFPKLNQLLARLERSHVPGLDEMVWATMAVTLNCAPLDSAKSMHSAVRHVKRHSPADIQAYLQDQDVHFIHPVPMALDAPERRLVRLLRDNQPVDFASFQAEFDSFRASVPLSKRLRSSVLTPVLSKLKDAQLHVLAE